MTKPYLNGGIDIRQLPPDDVVFGHSPEMAIVRTKVEMAAAINVPVLLQGESGTGKEILARLLHIRSPRARFPWVKVMCPAIPNSLIESELLGYEKGAFTGATVTKRGRVEQAHGGTLFLDEIGSLDLSVQAKLLQLLQDGCFMRVGGQETRSIDTRILSSANVDLKSRTEDGSFPIGLPVSLECRDHRFAAAAKANRGSPHPRQLFLESILSSLALYAPSFEHGDDLLNAPIRLAR